MGFLSNAMRAAVFSSIFATQAQSEAYPLPAIGGDVVQESEMEIEHIDKHIVFVLDVSFSVKPDEKVAMQKGIAEALASRQNEGHFNGYSTYAMTVVFFADTSASLETVFVTSQEQAVEAISKTLWDFDNQVPANNLSGVGSSTNMSAALTRVESIFDNEENDGYRARFKSVVVLGDAVPSSPSVISAQVGNLAQKYGATVHALPVVLQVNKSQIFANETVKYFQDAVATQPTARYHDEYGGHFDIEDGVTEPILGFGDVERAVKVALSLGRN